MSYTAIHFLENLVKTTLESVLSNTKNKLATIFVKFHSLFRSQRQRCKVGTSSGIEASSFACFHESRAPPQDFLL